MTKGELKLIIAFLLTIYVIVATGVYYTQNYVIFHSAGPSTNPPKQLNIKEDYIRTADGENLYVWWLQTANARRTILFFQENGRDLSYRKNRLATFQKLGANALLVDYRGYGRSSGQIQYESDIYTDGQAAWKYLIAAKGIPPQSIIIWGRSLGGGVAAEIARHKPLAALILESTFFSMDAMARRKYWFLPTRHLLRFHFATGRKLKQVRAPVIIIHSVEDHYIPFAQARALFEAANVPKTLIRTTGSHLDLFDGDAATIAVLLKRLNEYDWTPMLQKSEGFRAKAPRVKP